ncbi:unnamed protein product [Discosporangium mesarthrocarpum]
MFGGGGVDGAIHRAAGKQLGRACRTLPSNEYGVRCPTGEARITPGFLLEVKHIHTAGPVYHSLESSEPLLRNSYKNSLLLGRQHGVKTIAFPAISCGVYCFPLKPAAEVAVATVSKFSEGFDLVEFVLFGEDTFHPFLAAAKQVLPSLSRESRKMGHQQDASTGMAILGSMAVEEAMEEDSGSRDMHCDLKSGSGGAKDKPHDSRVEVEGGEDEHIKANTQK